MLKIGFDSEKYLAEQSAAILDRASKFGDKLYLEFGGKLICDFHAARVLPGFDPDAKIKLLQRLKDKIDIVICIYAGAIEEKKMRADFGLSYDADTMRTIDDLRDWGLDVNLRGVMRCCGSPCASALRCCWWYHIRRNRFPSLQPPYNIPSYRQYLLGLSI